MTKTFLHLRPPTLLAAVLAAVAAGVPHGKAFAAAGACALVATLQAAGPGNRWNVPVTSNRPDDVQYVADVIDDIASRVCLDAARVYTTGFSGGARMASLLACRLDTRVAAIAAMAPLGARTRRRDGRDVALLQRLLDSIRGRRICALTPHLTVFRA